MTAGRICDGSVVQKMKIDVLGRLLERLEEDVPAFLDALDLVDDEDLALEVGRRGVDARQQVAHVVDAVVGSRVELDHVERAALADGDARLARVVRLAVDRIEAVDGLGDDARHRRLARAARADEEQAVADSRPSRTALRSVSTTACWPMIWSNVWARQRR